jgi:hypothetical protein
MTVGDLRKILSPYPDHMVVNLSVITNILKSHQGEPTVEAKASVTNADVVNEIMEEGIQILQQCGINPVGAKRKAAEVMRMWPNITTPQEFIAKAFPPTI